MIPPQFVDIFVVYLLIVRRTQQLFAQVLWPGPDAAINYGTAWLVSDGVVMNSNQFSNELAACFSEHHNILIGVADYRHFATFFADIIRCAGTEDDANIIHETCAHEDSTAQSTYAVKASDMQHIGTLFYDRIVSLIILFFYPGRGRFQQFMRVIKLWHRLLIPPAESTLVRIPKQSSVIKTRHDIGVQIGK
jgi:hypothetical protein